MCHCRALTSSTVVSPIQTVVPLLTCIYMASALLLNNVNSLVLVNMWIEQSHGYGLVIYNCFKYVSIRNSHFDSNYWRGFLRRAPGGNALIYFDTATRDCTVIEVVNSFFSHGQYHCCNWELRAEGSGGLNIIVRVTTQFRDSQKVHHVFLVSVTNCSLINNTGQYGGNMFVTHGSSEVNVCIQNSYFINGTASITGGGLRISALRGGTGSFMIINSTFTQNFVLGNGGGVYIKMYEHHTITIVASRFLKNMATANGGGFYITATVDFERTGEVSMSDVLKLKVQQQHC